METSNIDLRCLAAGPATLVKFYNGYYVGGFIFHTEKYGRHKSTKNFGVCVKDNMPVKKLAFRNNKSRKTTNGTSSSTRSRNQIPNLANDNEDTVTHDNAQRASHTANDSSQNSTPASVYTLTSRRGAIRTPIDPEHGKKLARWTLSGDPRFTNQEAAKIISKSIKSDFRYPLCQWSDCKNNKEWMPMVEMWFKDFTDEFWWPSEKNDEARFVWEKHTEKILRDKLRDVRVKCMKEASADSISECRDIIWRPKWIKPEAWPAMVDFWTSDKFKKSSEAGKKNKAHSESKHSGGSIPFQCHEDRMRVQMGRDPTPIEVFVETHTKSDSDPEKGREFVDSRSRRFHAAYLGKMKEKTGLDSQNPPLDEEVWLSSAESVGPDRGRVYGLPGAKKSSRGGKFAASSSYQACPHTDEMIEEMVNQKVNARMEEFVKQYQESEESRILAVLQRHGLQSQQPPPN